MKLIPTSKFIFVIIDCYSSSEDISNSFQFTIQSHEDERVECIKRWNADKPEYEDDED